MFDHKTSPSPIPPSPKGRADRSHAQRIQSMHLGIQAKADGHGLKMGASNDAFEREADAMADYVTKSPLSHTSFQSINERSNGSKTRPSYRSSAPRIQQKKNSGKATGNAVNAPSQMQSQLNSTKGSGSALENQVSRSMGQAMNADFGNVRIHTDTKAASMNRAIGARAFTHQNDIYFNQGEFDPHSAAGKHLLAHELTHVVQQTGMIQKQDAAGAAPAAPVAMSRAEFDRIMTTTYGVTTIRTGTEVEQVAYHGMPPGTSIPGWQAWDPGANSDVYQHIIDSFTAFNTSFGGFPSVREISFYQKFYNRNRTTGVITDEPDTGAAFGRDTMAIFEKTATARKGLPVARSNAAGNYANPPGIQLGYNGDPNAAPIKYPTQRTSVMRLITHELGHGLGVAAATAGYNGMPGAADATIFIDYMSAIGWHNHNELYDIGVPAVRTAIAANTQPNAQHRITAANWNDPNWVEQPISSYMVSGGPGEDFAEAVMLFIEDPALLLARSPARHAFITARIATILPRLTQPAPPAAAPAPAPGP